MSVGAQSFQSTKQLRATLTLGAPGAQFAGTGDNTLIVENLRMNATIQAVVRFAAQLDLRIYGMRQEDMNALTVLFFGPTPSVQLNNTVTLEANSGNGWTQVFFGTIVQGSPDYRGIPNVPFHIQGRFGYFAGITPGLPLSYPNGASAVSALQTVANALNVTLENNGVTAMLPAGSYFPGAPWTQLRTICHAANVDFYTEPGLLVICPKGQPRTSSAPVTVSPTSGLIGYPRIEVGGIGLDVLYSTAIVQAGRLTVSGSDVPAANRTWMPYALTHSLESWQPSGLWQSSVHCMWTGES